VHSAPSSSAPSTASSSGITPNFDEARHASFELKLLLRSGLSEQQCSVGIDPEVSNELVDGHDSSEVKSSTKFAPVVTMSSCFLHPISGKYFVLLQLYLPIVTEIAPKNDQGICVLRYVEISDKEGRKITELHTADWRIIVKPKFSSTLVGLLRSTVADNSSELLLLEEDKNDSETRRQKCHKLIYSGDEKSDKYDLIDVSTGSYPVKNSCCDSGWDLSTASQFLPVGNEVLCGCSPKVIVATMSEKRAGTFYVVDLFLPVSCEVTVSSQSVHLNSCTKMWRGVDESISEEVTVESSNSTSSSAQ
jgi:hypothetical protein